MDAEIRAMFGGLPMGFQGCAEEPAPGHRHSFSVPRVPGSMLGWGHSEELGVSLLVGRK